MENLSNRTAASVLIGFLLVAVAWGLVMETLAKPATTVHCDSHLHFVMTRNA